MKAERLKNRCQKRVVFQRRFFRVLASILEPLGPQVGAKLIILASQNVIFMRTWRNLSKKEPPRRLKSAKMTPQGAPKALK